MTDISKTVSTSAELLERIKTRTDRVDQGLVGNPRKPDQTRGQAVPFSDLLEKNLQAPSNKAGIPSELKFSAHAKARLESRGIELSPDDLVRLQEAVGRVREKGSKESLVLTDQAAFVVSVKNNTVITAVDRTSLKENVFTNIDSTVIV